MDSGKNQTTDTIHWFNSGSIFDQRRRRWFNIKPALGLCLVYVGTPTTLLSIYPSLLTHQTWNVEPLLVQCWSTVYDAGPALNQQSRNVSYPPGTYDHGLYFRTSYDISQTSDWSRWATTSQSAHNPDTMQKQRVWRSAGAVWVSGHVIWVFWLPDSTCPWLVLLVHGRLSLWP